VKITGFIDCFDLARLPPFAVLNPKLKRISRLLRHAHLMPHPQKPDPFSFVLRALTLDTETSRLRLKSARVDLDEIWEELGRAKESLDLAKESFERARRETEDMGREGFEPS
jgi:hypothetical protein